MLLRKSDTKIPEERESSEAVKEGERGRERKEREVREKERRREKKTIGGFKNPN